MNEKLFFSENHLASRLSGFRLAQPRKSSEWKHLFGCVFPPRPSAGSGFGAEESHFGWGLRESSSKRCHRDSAKNISDRGDETQAGTGASKKATIQNIQDLHLYSTTRWTLKIEICVGGESGRKEANSVSQNLWHRVVQTRTTSCLRIFIDAFSGVCLRGPAVDRRTWAFFTSVQARTRAISSHISLEWLARPAGLIAVQNLNERKLYNYHFLSCRPFFFTAPRFRRSLALFSVRKIFF